MHSRSLPHKKKHLPCRFIPRPKKNVVGDHQLSADDPSVGNQIVRIGTPVPTVVANSFTEFLDCYLRDDEHIYFRG
jgi:hypothetical protein